MYQINMDRKYTKKTWTGNISKTCVSKISKKFNVQARYQKRYTYVQNIDKVTKTNKQNINKNLRST